MKLKVEHVTLFEYDKPVYETATEVRLQPRNDPGSPQRSLDFVLQLKPSANITYYTDFYGNNVHQFNVLTALQQIEIRAISLVETGEGFVPSRPGEEIMLVDFLNPSRYVQFSPLLRSSPASSTLRMDHATTANWPKPFAARLTKASNMTRA